MGSRVWGLGLGFSQKLAGFRDCAGDFLLAGMKKQKEHGDDSVGFGVGGVGTNMERNESWGITLRQRTSNIKKTV